MKNKDNIPQAGEVYTHTKSGEQYVVYSVSKSGDKESNQLFITYRRRDDVTGSQLFTRTLEDFQAFTKDNKRRFELCHNDETFPLCIKISIFVHGKYRRTKEAVITNEEQLAKLRASMNELQQLFNISLEIIHKNANKVKKVSGSQISFTDGLL